MKGSTRMIVAGLMIAALTLLASTAMAKVREYWIAADEVNWDYAPSFPTNLMSGEDFTDDQRVFVEEAIGRVYVKSLYREYTADFQALKPRGPGEEHLGILGPVVRAEVGDKIIIHFKNNTAFPASIHPHGVFYTKEHEGAPYADGTSGADKDDDLVPANGGTHTYVWGVPNRAGTQRPLVDCLALSFSFG